MWFISDLMSKKNSGQWSVDSGQFTETSNSSAPPGGSREDTPVLVGGRITTDRKMLTTDHWPLTADLRVVLFDIDGTLIKTVRRGEYRGLIHSMLLDVFGTCGRINEVDFGGRTDLAIYREALECEGITPVQIRERLPLVEAATVEILNHLASTGEVFRLCPGVRELLDAMSVDLRFLPSLLTGNVEKLAEALGVFGIAVNNQVSFAQGEAVRRIHELPGHLSHPLGVGGDRRAAHMDGA